MKNIQDEVSAELRDAFAEQRMEYLMELYEEEFGPPIAPEPGSKLFERLRRPVEGPCAECGYLTDHYDAENDDYICPGCNADIVAGQERDKFLDLPTRR